MSFFLLNYNRAKSAVRVQTFEDEELALRELRLSEAEKSDDSEIVLLIGNREDDLKVTHARYFKDALGLVSEASEDLNVVRRFAQAV